MLSLIYFYLPGGKTVHVYDIIVQCPLEDSVLADIDIYPGGWGFRVLPQCQPGLASLATKKENRHWSVT